MKNVIAYSVIFQNISHKENNILCCLRFGQVKHNLHLPTYHSIYNIQIVDRIIKLSFWEGLAFQMVSAWNLKMPTFILKK